MPIVAVGGGDIRTGETLPIDDFIVKLTGRKQPRALFIPTAMADPPDYCEAFEIEFGQRLGCRVDHLFLVREQPALEEIRAKVLASDLIYVGGGSTLNLMKMWRRTGLDEVLGEAHRQGIVLSGMSAGANCWFGHAHSDSASFFKVPRPGYYMRVTCLGIAKGTYCPHVIGEGRLTNFRQMVLKYGGPGYAVDNYGAVVVDGKSVRALRCSADVVVRKLIRCLGRVEEVDIEPLG